jgi:UDP-N-acetylmuramoyl-L-alanyl-D-glutamate--2,6-diaminopimelate ligase
MIRRLKRIAWLMSFYHLALAWLGAAWYGFPSRKLTVIGVTGTKGKTTTSNFIADLLNAAGRKTGAATTVNFRIGYESWPNRTKQTMLGRFGLQRFLRKLVNEGCTHAVIETSSEGILQHRHRFIDYDICVFTNISPEHIERHGSFEQYRAAKVKLFELLAQKKDGVAIINTDDPNAIWFLKPKAARTIGYGFENPPVRMKERFDAFLRATDIELRPLSSMCRVEGERATIPLGGDFNIRNALAALGVLVAEQIPLWEGVKLIGSLRPVPGRMEVITEPGFPTVIVDYAHEPASLEAIYKAAEQFKPKKMIGVLGAQGGGRDIWKREAMGKLAGTYLDAVVLADEDPYDDDPRRILKDIEGGVHHGPKIPKTRVYTIIDRKEAIKQAIELGSVGDLVVLTGKGGEVWMCKEKGKKIPWDETETVREIIREKKSEKLARKEKSPTR